MNQTVKSSLKENIGLICLISAISLSTIFLQINYHNGVSTNAIDQKLSFTSHSEISAQYKAEGLSEALLPGEGTLLSEFSGRIVWIGDDFNILADTLNSINITDSKDTLTQTPDSKIELSPGVVSKTVYKPIVFPTVLVSGIALMSW